MTRCRIGLVGAGGVARRHARTLAAMGDVDLVGVTDVDPSRRDAFAAEAGIRPSDDVAALLARGPDAVWVCVPPFAHGEVEEAVAAAGVALFVEKPLGLDVATAERVAAAVRASGIPTATGHHWRSSAAVRRAQRIVAGRAVRLVTASWLDKVPPVAWWSRRSGSGGQVVEQAVHVLDLVRLLAGEVTEVHAFGDGTPSSADADVDSATVAVLRLAGGGVGTVAATSRLGWKHRAGVEVYGDGLALSLTEEGLVARDEDGPVELTVDPDAARTAADRAFVDVVRGRPPTDPDDSADPDDPAAGVVVDHAEALRTHRLACALADSAVAHTVVPPRDGARAGR